MAATDSLTSGKKSKGRETLQAVTDFDLFYQLIYMSAVASAGIARNRIFELASRLPRKTAAYFRRVQLLAHSLGYDYASACSMVGESVSSESMKSILLRFADALASGQPEVTFLTDESVVQGDAYEKEYERDIASLTKWTDAYAAVVVSSALIIIINLVSSLLSTISVGAIAGMVSLAVITSSGGAWVLSRAAPSEVKAVFEAEGPADQLRTRRLIRITLPLLVAACALMAVLGLGLGPILVVAGAMLLPAGLASQKAEKEVSRKDKEIAAFLRSLGGTAMSTGTTITEALTRIDTGSFPTLKGDLEKLRWRLSASIAPELCWERFARDTGSKLISETVNIFNDAVKLGGDADTVGNLSSEFATKTIQLRAKRSVVASTFSWLTMAMHGVLATLVVIILEVITQFTHMVQAAVTVDSEQALRAFAGTLPGFGSVQTQILQPATTIMVLMLALINAIAIVVTDGGHAIKTSYYLAILLILSGVSFIVVPPLMASIFTP